MTMTTTWLSVFENNGITETNLPSFMRSIGFYNPISDMTTSQWNEAYEELRAINEEGLLHTYLNQLTVDEGTHYLEEGHLV